MMYQMHQIYQTPGFYEPSHQTHQMQAFYGANYQMQPYLSTGFTSLHNPGISYYSDHITTGPHSSTYYIVPQHGAYMNMMASDPVGQYPQAVSNYRLQPPAGQPQLQRQASERPGFAVWIGNLPPKTELFDLVNYVCLRTVGVESIFFISKSNCAFANFKEEQQSVDAQQLLHACQFRNARLVCRLQPANDAYKGAAASAELEPESPAIGHCKLPLGAAVSAPQSQNRFFILKSLTLEYLQRSVTTGIWATQTQNEQILAEAYETTENVYLIFSANKSGEYFGYARMISQINQDPRATIEFAPQEQTPTERNEPRPVPVEANGNRPMGHVIHRSDRGTLFWQVVRDSKDDDDDNDNDDVENTQTGAADDETQTRGKPFHLAWLSSSRLPFYRTRGLRNPWNSNREVKVARDGTELEPSVGKTLISLFNRNYSLGGSVPESA